VNSYKNKREKYPRSRSIYWQIDEEGEKKKRKRIEQQRQDASKMNIPKFGRRDITTNGGSEASGLNSSKTGPDKEDK